MAKNLSTIRRLLSQSIPLATAVDQPGDDEDLVDDIDWSIELLEACKRVYVTGKPVDRDVLRFEWEQRRR